MNNDNLIGVKGLHLCHLNTCSLIKNIDLVKNHLWDSGIHIMTLSETWIRQETDLNTLAVNNYNFATQRRNFPDGTNENIKRGGGVGAYILETINFSKTELERFNISSCDIECMWLTIKQPNQRKMIIGRVYRQPKGKTSICIDYLTETLNQINQLGNADIFLMGDFNINYRDPKNPERRALKNFERLTGLRQLINETTRPSQANSIIDLIFTNSPVIMNSGTLNWNISDHEVIFATRKKISQPISKVSFRGRSYRNYAREPFKYNLANQDWGELYTSSNANDNWEIIINRISVEINRTCPLRDFKVKSKRDPWINNEILEKIKDKDQARRRAKASGLADDWRTAAREKNEVRQIIRRAKTDYIKGNLERHKGDAKKFWQIIGELVPTNKSKRGQISLVDKDTDQPIKAEDTATFINKYFTEIGPNLAKNCNTPWSYNGKLTDNVIDDIFTTEEEIVKLCKDINTMKSSGVENISSTIFKDAFLAIPAQVSFMINNSLQNCIFPDKWKMATIIPLQKEGDSSDVNNLRPISLLPLPGKLTEKIVANRISGYLESNQLLNPKQGGFRPNHSTTDTVAKFTDDIFLAMNNKETTLALFVDFRKAFDTVNHNILIKKLNRLGITGKSSTWLIN